MPHTPRPSALRATAAFSLLFLAGTSYGQPGPGACSTQSGPFKTPVIELYTSEGCSSCPPADKWLSGFKTAADKAKDRGKAADRADADASAPVLPVVQAFHVGYWDYIGWVDRFATPAHTTRQRQVAAQNRQGSIYTPQAVLDGRDWRDWHRHSSGAAQLGTRREAAQASISLKQLGPDQFEALVTPAPGQKGTWSAYWTLTEDGHSSKVKSGENAGEFLSHDFVVRQYTPAGDYAVPAAQKLGWRSIAATPGHARRVNLVVFETKTGQTLQAVSLACSG